MMLRCWTLLPRCTANFPSVISFCSALFTIKSFSLFCGFRCQHSCRLLNCLILLLR
jgi:hypothetical protein